MDRRIQVIDQLGADGGLRQNKLNGGERILSVPFQYVEERGVRFRVVQTSTFHRRRIGFRKARNRTGRMLELIALLSAGGATSVARQSLAGVRQHELITLFDGVAPGADLRAHL